MQGFLRTPWNATSRTTAQDALWQHIMDRNTSSQPFMTPCARQVMNRIPGNVTPPWAASLMRNEWHNIRTSTEKPTTIKADPQTEAPTAPRQGDPVSRVTFARNMESSPQWWTLQFPVAWLSLRNFLWSCKSVSHNAEMRQKRPVIVWEMLKYLLKSPIPQWWGKWKNGPEFVSWTVVTKS